MRYLSGDEETRLRAALDSRDDERRASRDSANIWRRERDHDELPPHGLYTDALTPIVLLALNTGLRRGELFHLQWTDVDLQRRTLTVRGEHAKTGQTRHVPLNREAADVLSQWRVDSDQPEAYVFYGSSELHPRVAIRKPWAAALKAAGIDRFRVHDLRHTFASNLVMLGVDLNTVRELLGHKSVAMTLRYAHLAPEHKAAAVETLVAKRHDGRAA